MSIDPQQTIYYKRARFTTRLPVNRLYAQAHFWLSEEASGLWRIGCTKFATRMLGDFVELRFDVTAGERLEVGQPIGCIEGFKAVSDIYCVAEGEFAGANDDLDRDPTLLDRDPYDAGWLYRVRGRPADSALDVHGYIGLLDATVDRMLSEQERTKETQC